MSISHSPSGKKTYFSTTNTFERKFGFHRAVRKGPFIFVSGTTSLNPETGKIEHPGDAYKQALAAMKTSIDAVQQLGGSKMDVVRVRMYVMVSQTAIDPNQIRFQTRIQTAVASRKVSSQLPSLSLTPKSNLSTSETEPNSHVSVRMTSVK